MIRDIRKSKKITTQDLSRMSGVSSTSISRYENGKRTPNIIAAYKISKALGCKIEDLLTGTEKGE